MVALTFYDLRTRKSFTTSSYRTVTKNGRKFAVAKAPSGGEAWRIVA